MIPFFPRDTAGIVIFVVAAVLAAAAGIWLRRRLNRRPPSENEMLMKRAESHAGKSPFLRNMCRQFRANGHLSRRQIAQIEKALARLENGRR
jgi:hypothetical protein